MPVQAVLVEAVKLSVLVLEELCTSCACSWGLWSHIVVHKKLCLVQTLPVLKACEISCMGSWRPAYTVQTVVVLEACQIPCFRSYWRTVCTVQAVLVREVVKFHALALIEETVCTVQAVLVLEACEHLLLHLCCHYACFYAVFSLRLPNFSVCGFPAAMCHYTGFSLTHFWTDTCLTSIYEIPLYFSSQPLVITRFLVFASVSYVGEYYLPLFYEISCCVERLRRTQLSPMGANHRVRNQPFDSYPPNSPFCSNTLKWLCQREEIVEERQSGCVSYCSCFLQPFRGHFATFHGATTWSPSWLFSFK